MLLSDKIEMKYEQPAEKNVWFECDLTEFQLLQ